MYVNIFLSIIMDKIKCFSRGGGGVVKECNTVNIVLFWTNQIADILCVSDDSKYMICRFVCV